MRKLLAEIVEQQLRLVAQYGQGCVVPHRCRRFQPIDTHRDNGVVDVFRAETEHQFVARKLRNRIIHLASAFQLFQLDAVGRQPLAVGMFGGKLFFDFPVIIYFPFLCVDKEDFAGLQASLLRYFRGVEIHDTHFRGHQHHVVLRNRVACRAQTVAVEHTAGITSVAEEQRRWPIPRFHQNGIIFVESLQIFRDGILVVKTFRHKEGERMRQRKSRHDKEFKYVVQAG